MEVLAPYHVPSSLLNLCPQAFFQGKLKITGNMGLAMKLQSLQIAPGKAKL